VAVEHGAPAAQNTAKNGERRWDDGVQECRSAGVMGKTGGVPPSWRRLSDVNIMLIL